MSIAFRMASSSDAEELTRIAFAAKRHWGYPEDWIALWADELRIGADYIEANWVILAAAGSRTLGWCAVSAERGECWLDNCWVLPEAAASGIGRALVGRALRHAAGLSSPTLRVISDPNAEGFYLKLGFRRIGDHPSEPVGRRLPVLEVKVEHAA